MNNAYDVVKAIIAHPNYEVNKIITNSETALKSIYTIINNDGIKKEIIDLLIALIGHKDKDEILDFNFTINPSIGKSIISVFENIMSQLEQCDLQDLNINNQIYQLTLLKNAIVN